MSIASDAITDHRIAGKKLPFDIVIIDRSGKVYNRVELKFLDDLQFTCKENQIGRLLPMFNR